MKELKALMTKEATAPRFILTDVKVVILQHVREKSMTDAVRASSTNTLAVAVVAAGGIEKEYGEPTLLQLEIVANMMRCAMHEAPTFERSVERLLELVRPYDDRGLDLSEASTAAIGDVLTLADTTRASPQPL